MMGFILLIPLKYHLAGCAAVKKREGFGSLLNLEAVGDDVFEWDRILEEEFDLVVVGRHGIYRIAPDGEVLPQHISEGNRNIGTIMSHINDGGAAAGYGCRLISRVGVTRALEHARGASAVGQISYRFNRSGFNSPKLASYLQF